MKKTIMEEVVEVPTLQNILLMLIHSDSNDADSPTRIRTGAQQGQQRFRSYTVYATVLQRRMPESAVFVM